MKKITILCLSLAAVLFLGQAAKADQMEYVSLAFQSGATFKGVVDFSNDWSQLTGVAGTLTGYESGTSGYVGAGTDPISWIWYPGNNFAGVGGNVFGSWLMDGSNYFDYHNFISFTYDYTNAPNLTLQPGDGYGINIDYQDPMVSGKVSPTPEPGSLLLLGTGILGVAGMAFRKFGLTV